MKPGDRRHRWNQANAIEATIFFAMAIALNAFAMNAVTLILGIVCAGMALLAIRDIHRGWLIKTERPSWADRHDAIQQKRCMMETRDGK